MITLLKPPFASWKLLASILCILIVRVIYIFLKCILKRWQLRKLPGMGVKMLDVWGDMKNFQTIPPPNLSNNLNVYTLQTFSAYTQLFRDKMIYCFWFSYIPALVIVKAEAVEQLISRKNNLKKDYFYDFVEPWLNTGLLTSHGQKWKSRRKLLTPCFHFDILKDFLPTMNKKSQILVEILRKETEKDWTNVGALINLCTLDIICETTLGVDLNVQENNKSEYIEALARVSSIAVRRMTNPLYLFDSLFYMTAAGRQFKKDVKVLHEFTRSVINKKKAKLLSNKPSEPKNRKALMDVLLEHHLQNADLTEEDIREEVDTFTFAGHDTTYAGITWALYLIGLYKDVQERVHKELEHIFGDDDERFITTDDIRDMEYLDRVLKESQRLYPSVPMFGRRSDSGTVINGYEIPEGTDVGVLTYEVHRDPDVYPDPEKFDPDRFLPENSANRHPYAYIPFSAGPRNCVGQRFAVMEEKVIIADILRNYSVESLDPRDKVVPTPEVILRSAETLRIRLRYRMLL